MKTIAIDAMTPAERTIFVQMLAAVALTRALQDIAGDRQGEHEAGHNPERQASVDGAR